MSESKAQNGFKQTEIGQIPAAWCVKALGAIVNFQNGKAHENCISSTGCYIVVNSKFISTYGKIKKYSHLCLQPISKGSILMVMSDVPNGRAIGRCFFVESDDTYTLNQRICSLNANSCEPKFLFYFLNRNRYFLAFDDGVKQTNLRRVDILSCPVPIPPTIEEQKAIAGVLSDTDDLIEALEQLIEKKRLIKKGAMQELLTGKRRLPGFKKSDRFKQTEIGLIPEDWLNYSVGDLISFVGGSQPDKSNFIYKEKIDYVRLLQIRDYKSNKFETFIPRKLARRFCNENDIMIGRYGPPIFQILKGISGAYNVALIKAIPCEKINQNYAFHFFRQEVLFNFVEKLSQRTSGQTGVDLKELKDYPLNLPSTMEEQETIARVLSDMDSEIEALENKLGKYRQIKQGIMEKLLTGKIRLV